LRGDSYSHRHRYSNGNIFASAVKRKDYILSTLMVSISGIRGEVGGSLTPQAIQKYALAFGTYCKSGKVILGRDSRVSGPFVADIVKGALIATGCHVIEIGVAPTPTVQLEVERHKAAGGIAITASHNPIQWNGLKFMGSNGQFLSPAEAEKVYRMGEAGQFVLQEWQHLGELKVEKNAVKKHIEKVLALKLIDVKAIRERNFKVALDTVNGAGGVIMPQLLKELGCDVYAINEAPSGKFAHTPEPLPENLSQLKETILQHNCDVGFAVDPDVDRCALVNEKGCPLGEEYTLAIAAKLIFSKQMGRMVVNMSTSRASEDIAQYYNCTFFRSKVGEINVAEKMAEVGAIIGGEGNGGVILPELHLGRDAPLAAALTLQAMLEFGGSLSEIKASLPQYEMAKLKANIEGMDAETTLKKIAERYQHEALNLLDGVKIDFSDSWVHLRKSNTEPIIRVIAEAPTMEKALALANKLMKEIKDC
jgi:phosphomannomutase